jgi:hypothetical protein
MLLMNGQHIRHLLYLKRIMSNLSYILAMT